MAITVKPVKGKRQSVRMSSRRRRVERLRARPATEADPRVRQSIEAQLRAFVRD